MGSRTVLPKFGVIQVLIGEAGAARGGTLPAVLGPGGAIHVGLARPDGGQRDFQLRPGRHEPAGIRAVGGPSPAQAGCPSSLVAPEVGAVSGPSNGGRELQVTVVW